MGRISGRDEEEKVGSSGASGLLFDNRGLLKGATHNKLDVSFARLLKHEQLTWPELFGGFETLRAITYASSASFIRDWFGRLRGIQVVFGSDVSITGSKREYPRHGEPGPHKAFGEAADRDDEQV